MAQQRVQSGFAASEGLERLYRGAAAASLENGLAIFSSGFDARQTVFTRCLFKRGIRIGAQDLRPLVAVVARRVAASKDVTESMSRAAEGRRLDHRDLL